MTDLVNEIEQCLHALNTGGIILYPTDTIWGIGCDATDDKAVKKIFNLKQREDSKTMIILITVKMDISRYVTKPAGEIAAYISNSPKPVTAIYKQGKNVAPGLISGDGTLAIRVTHNEFCSALINKLGKPLVSTSANLSGKTTPANFNDIDKAIKKGVDYIVQHHQGDLKTQPSTIIKLSDEGEIIVVRS